MELGEEVASVGRIYIYREREMQGGQDIKRHYYCTSISVFLSFKASRSKACTNESITTATSLACGLTYTVLGLKQDEIALG